MAYPHSSTLAKSTINLFLLLQAESIIMEIGDLEFFYLFLLVVKSFLLSMHIFYAHISLT